MDTSAKPVRIVYLDDSPADARLAKNLVESAGDELSASVQPVFTKAEYLTALKSGGVDLILAEHRMPGYDGDRALEDARAQCPGVPFIMVTGELGEEQAIETLKAGATDYVMRDNFARLVPAIRRALKEAALARERQHLERTLHESEERFRSLLANSRDVIYRLNVLTAQYEYISPSATAVVGFSPEELMKLDAEAALSMIHPDDLPAMRAALVRMEQTGRAEVEYRQRTKTGEYRWLSNHMSCMRDESGRPLYRVGNIRDISKGKEVEEKLAQNYQKLSEILGSIQEDFYVLDRNWVFVFASMRFTSRIGKAPKDFVGCNIWEMFPKHIGTPFEQNLRAAMEKREIRRFEVGGKYTNAWYSMAAFPSAEGITVLGSDITESKRTEEAMRANERIYRAVGESIDYGIWICDPNGRNTYASPSLLKLAGMTQEECSEFGWGDYLHPDDAAGTIAAWQRCTREGTFWEREHRFRGVDGKYHHILARGVPIRDEDGTITCWAGINLDIDDMKRKEEALRQSEEHFSAAFYGSPFPQAISRIKDGTFLDINDAYLAFYGLKREEVIGKPSSSLGILSDHRERELLVSALQRSGTLHSFEMHVRSRILGERLVSLSASMLGTSREPTMLTVFSDITERRRAEEAVLRQAQLIDLSPDAIIIRTMEGEIEFWSKGAESLYGWTAEEAIGQASHRLLRSVFPEPLDEINRRLSETGLWAGEITHTTKACQKVVVQSRWLAQFDDRHRLKSIFESNVDVTERKLALQALTTSYENLKLMVARSREAMIVVQGDGTIDAVSAKGESILAYEEGELSGRNIAQLADTMSRLEFSIQLKQLKDNAPKPLITQWRVKAKSGALIWISLEASFVGADSVDERYFVKFEKLDLPGLS